MVKLKSFWEEKHLSGDVNALSGCDYNLTIDVLKMAGKITKGMNVLEVGIGLGYTVRDLHGMGVKVSATDISKKALDTVNEYCEKTYLVEDISELPTNYFDVILCVNVIQHIPTNELINELTEIMRSLKMNGTFAVEFVSSNKFNDNGVNCSFDDAQAGRLCRTPKYLEEIIKKMNGKCELVSSKQIKHVLINSMNIFHVHKIK